ncbi:DNA mismatch repair endonuclease MutL [Croceitalea sp. MTPC9]|uniref:DNA mismatch repair endonuclease MutL n=1 Tax=unclassified Croceitalea TaxID=2632280 RepID=UPI002B3A35C9|nr:DNA mismatch repair endonuclease MutL [Croceitalea sp. MTPC6]GMN15257.1 DNA mismatch repair endonuclease MutL [Croceitalea sp. MTPC9]
MADIIKLLPDHVANQIAAGEVVQRPASVVKELLENAIDAGATTIKLIVKDGGKALIQVVDDGIGMSGTDARLSFERHATSKISSAEDLFDLRTKGFRGEALASIAAIAHVDLQTRTAKAETGTHIKIEGSKVVFQEVAVTPKGSSISVKNLFFNIPARRNFLKSNQVELRHITDEFQRVALVHPSVAFRYYNNGSELFNLQKESFRQRIVHVFGTRMNERLVPVEEGTEVIRISGFICKPEFARKSRGEQFFFANGRFIKSPYLHHAVIAAFEGLIKSDTHPGYFLNLEVDPASIDINIHPTKTEVKFDDENTLYAILRSTIKHSLGQFSVAPVLDFERDGNLDTPYAYQTKEATLPKVTVDRAFNPFDQIVGKTKQAANFKKQNVQGWENLYVDTDSNNFSSVEFESEGITPEIFETQSDEAPLTQTTFQLKRKYIVTTIKSGMVLIDQNRAHQRILYERFLQDITVKDAISQQLLFPLDFQFGKKELEVLSSMEESLINLGFVLNITNEAVKVTGIPSIITESGIGIVLEELILNFSEGYESEGFSQAELMAKTLSKSLAVKTGHILEQDSQIALVNDLFGCKEPNLSPFHKKTFVTLAADEIDKKFS